MKTKVLGRTGLTVKRLGFGGIPIQRISETAAIRVVHRCFELGINYFDTARNYSVSESHIGQALQNMRSQVILATKSSNRTQDGVLQELEVSLQQLRTEYIDLYQLRARALWRRRFH